MDLPSMHVIQVAVSNYYSLTTMLYVLVGLCSFYAIWTWLKEDETQPPVLPGRLPIIGHGLMFLRDSVGLYDVIKKISETVMEKDGIMRIYLGLSKLYCVTDPEDCITILNTCFHKHNVYEITKPFLGNGLLTADVPTWKRNRKLLNPAFNQQVLNSFIGVFNSQANKLVDRFADKLNIEFDHDEILCMNGLETICLTTTGEEEDEHCDLRKQYLPHFRRILHLTNLLILKVWLHSETIYKWSSLKREQIAEVKHIDKLSNSILQKKKLEMKNATYTKNSSGKFKPFIDLILELSNESSSFTDKQVCEEVNTIIAAGHETNSTTLGIALMLLGYHHGVQEKAYEEIVKVIGNLERNVDQEDLPNLEYIEAILKETLRLYPVGPLIARQLEEDVKLRNYTLKANSGCIISIYGINRHKMWGADVNEFKPERWLDKDTLPDPKYFAAFGLGRRSCIGKTYAMMSMKIILVHILRKYRISSDASKMVLKINLLLKPASGFNISITHRNAMKSENNS